MATVGLLLNLALEFYMFLFFVRMIMSFAPANSAATSFRYSARVSVHGAPPWWLSRPSTRSLTR